MCHIATGDMTTYTFTIRGNHEDPFGNPIPFQRVIKQQMRYAAARYLAWMKYVRAVFVSECEVDSRMVMMAARDGPPISLAKGQTAGIAIRVFWANETHGDLDNVLKGILDSLFENDKGINALKASCEMAEDRKGRVEITITINEPI